MLFFNLCHEHATGMSEYIDVWDDDGQIDVFNKDNAEPGSKSYSIREEC
jgi:hypothetical protein